jgi:hypothetical protein
MRLALWSSLVFLGLGCTNVLYDGPARDSDATSVIFSGAGTSMQTIDGRPVEDGAFTRFQVEPGPHSVEIELSQEGPSPQAARRLRTTCFEARPSRLYEVQTEPGARIRASVIDANNGRKVGSPCTPSTPTASAAVEADGGTDSNDDTEAEQPSPSRRPPMASARVGLGEAVGGETAFEVQYSNGDSNVLHNGDGITVTLALALVPYWIGDSLGLGLGASTGFKYGWLDADGSSASISHTSIATWFQLVFRPTNLWFGTFALGAQKDFDISVNTNADGQSKSFSLKSDWGFMSELGLYRLLSRHFGCGFVLRFVKIDYTVNDQVAAADSFGGEFTLNFPF